MLTRSHGARALPFVIAVAAAVCTPAVCTTEARGGPKDAKDMETCIASHEKSQELKKDSKLKAAREQLINCARDVCPSMIKKECSQMLEEVDASMPSVVVEGKDTEGKEAIEMKVTVDGEPFVDKLDGRAINIDPGVHVFKFELPNGRSREEKVVIREGQKNRKVVADFSPPKPEGSAVPTATATVAPTPDPVSVKRPVPVAVYVLGGLGLVSLGASAYFEASGLGQRSDLDDKGCKPACDKSDVDAAKRSILIGDIALGVGVVSLGTAAVLYFTRPAVKVNKEAAWTFDVRQLQGGAVAGVRGSF